MKGTIKFAPTPLSMLMSYLIQLCRVSLRRPLVSVLVVVVMLLLRVFVQLSAHLLRAFVALHRRRWSLWDESIQIGLGIRHI